MNLTYNEGGNTLIGKRKGEPFALIGKDSYAVSKFLMEADLGHEMTYEEILIAFALDYGVKKENIHFIEQPGDMHLDMSMTIVGENTILLNDAQEAQRMFRDEQQMWLSATSGYESAEILASYVSSEILESKARKIMEDITEKELQGLGFNVVRVPGRFNYSITAPAMNFFNMVTAQTPSGENIAVLLGCVANYASIFEQTLRKFSERKIDKVYFLNLEASQQCLGLDGGISCRTKSIPLVR